MLTGTNPLFGSDERGTARTVDLSAATVTKLRQHKADRLN